MSKKIFFTITAILLIPTTAALLIGFAPRSEITAQGCFHQVAHKGGGCAALVRRPDGKTVLELTDFATADSSDLRVLLISAEDALENTAVLDSKKVDLGPLETDDGTQELVVPKRVDVTMFHAVTVWNARHQVNFTTAPLRR